MTHPTPAMATDPTSSRASINPNGYIRQHEPPLWQLMLHAYDEAPAPPRDAPDDWTDRRGYAAELLEVRDWLKQRLPEGGAWHALLTTEAAKAEQGEP